MSYILDALKKADQERSIGQVPDLEASHWGVRRRSQRNYWVWIIALLVLLNLVLVLVLVVRDADTPPATAAGDAVIAEVPAGRDAVTLPAATPTPVPPATPPQRQRAPRPVKPVIAPVAPPPTPAVITAPQPVPAIPASPRVQLADSGHDLPEWGELSLEFRSRFPLPHVDVHVHDDDPARRFIMIQLKKYREGQTLASGAKLERINPDNIELEFEGTRFRVDR